MVFQSGAMLQGARNTHAVKLFPSTWKDTLYGLYIHLHLKKEKELIRDSYSYCNSGAQWEEHWTGTQEAKWVIFLGLALTYNAILGKSLHLCVPL